jgi:hypothetical protein
MARSHRRHPSKTTIFTPTASQVFRGKRDDYSIATDPIFENSFSRSVALPDLDTVWSTLNDVEDRRHFTPGRSGSFQAASTRSRVTPTKTNLSLTSSVIEAFKAPRNVAICVRRKIRKQVLHALKKTGKGSSPPRRRNNWSNVKCSG